MPQRKGDVSPEDVERLVAAMAAFKAARIRRDRAITRALKAGGSIREVAAVTGMSPSSIQKIGHANGWPTEEQRTERDRQRQEHAEWNRMIDEGVDRILKRDKN